MLQLALLLLGDTEPTIAAVDTNETAEVEHADSCTKSEEDGSEHTVLRRLSMKRSNSMGDQPAVPHILQRYSREYNPSQPNGHNGIATRLY